MVGQAERDVACICLNGHMVNSAGTRFPHLNYPYCVMCGAETITTCQHCQANITGRLYTTDIDLIATPTVPFYCHNCGKPYPWTEAILEAVRELADLELDEDDAAILKANLNDIVQDTARTNVAALKVKKAFEKVAPTAFSVFHDIVVDVASETAKKVLFGQ